MSVEKANRTWHAGKPKKKPDYDREELTEELLAAVVGVYEALDEYGNHPSLQAIVDELDCGLNPLKVRKLLITAGEVQGKKIYESATVDEVLSLWKEGKSCGEDYVHTGTFSGFRELIPSVHENHLQNEGEQRWC